MGNWFEDVLKDIVRERGGQMTVSELVSAVRDRLSEGVVVEDRPAPANLDRKVRRTIDKCQALWLDDPPPKVKREHAGRPPAMVVLTLEPPARKTEREKRRERYQEKKREKYRKKRKTVPRDDDSVINKAW